MKWYSCSKARLVWMAFIGALVIGPGWAVADFRFGPAVNLGPLFTGPYNNDGDPSISADGLSLYFGSDRPGGSGGNDLWVTTRTTISDTWGPPVNLGPTVNSSSDDGTPFISFDGLSLYFCSERPGSLNTPYSGHDLWMTTRATVSDPWGPPVHLDPPLNSRWSAYSPYVSADGLTLLFSGAVDAPDNRGADDIWEVTRPTKDSPWAGLVSLDPPVNLGSWTSGIEDDLSPYMTADGLTLFWVSGRPGGYGGYDIWVSKRTSISDNWAEPNNLGLGVNTERSPTWSPSVSADGSTLYFCGTRGGSKCHLWQAPITPIVDLNGDGTVDIKDLLRLIECWGTNEPSADIAPLPFGDGKVDEKDLEVLMSYWGQQLEVPPVPDPNLVAHWNLDETEGSVAKDSSRDYDATLNGGPVWQPAGGKVDGALQFDGIDDYVKTPSFVLNPALGAFSLFAWVKGGAPGQVILSQMLKANWLSTDADAGWLMTELKVQGSLGTTLQSQSVVTDGNWHRVGLVWDGTNRLLYVDDKEVARDTQPSLPGSSTALYIGAGSKLSKGTFWSGLIDDVRIYDQAVKP